MGLLYNIQIVLKHFIKKMMQSRERKRERERDGGGGGGEAVK